MPLCVTWVSKCLSLCQATVLTSLREVMARQKNQAVCSKARIDSSDTEDREDLETHKEKESPKAKSLLLQCFPRKLPGYVIPHW